MECPKFPIKEISNKLYEDCTPILPKEIINCIWKMKVPPRIQLVIWLANLEKLKTGDSLVERGVLDRDHGLCPFCESSIETITHVLFSCNFSWRIWMEVLNWWGMSGVLHNHCSSFTLALKGLVPRKYRGKVWNLILGCVLWSLWLERNKIKFENGNCDAGRFIFTLKLRVAMWARELLGLDISPHTTLAPNIGELL